MKRTFVALGTTVSLTVDGDVPGADVADLIVAGYPISTSPPQLAFRLRGGTRPALECANRYETAVETVEDLVPLFELDLYHALVEQAPPGWLLHAAALEHDGRAIVFAGPSGAGKTTLTLALLARGWRIVTEEIVLLDLAGVVTGLARPIHAKGAKIPSDWTRHTYPMRSSRGPLDSDIAQPPAHHRVSSPLPLRALVRIGHGPRVMPTLERVAPALALPRLWECSLRQDDAGLAAATTILANHPAYALESSSVGEAVDLAERLLTI